MQQKLTTISVTADLCVNIPANIKTNAHHMAIVNDEQYGAKMQACVLMCG